MNRRTGRYKNVIADNLKGKQIVLEKIITKEVIITNDPAVQSGVGTTVIDTDGPVVDGGSALTTLAALTDTTITSPAANDILQYVGGTWLNNPLALDVDSTNITVTSSATATAAGSLTTSITSPLTRVVLNSTTSLVFVKSTTSIDSTSATGVWQFNLPLTAVYSGANASVDLATGSCLLAGSFSVSTGTTPLSEPVKFVQFNNTTVDVCAIIPAGDSDYSYTLILTFLLKGSNLI